MDLHYHIKIDLSNFYGIKVQLVFKDTYDDQAFIMATYHHINENNEPEIYQATFEIETTLIKEGKFTLLGGDLIQWWIEKYRNQILQIAETKELLFIPPLK